MRCASPATSRRARRSRSSACRRGACRRSEAGAPTSRRTPLDELGVRDHTDPLGALRTTALPAGTAVHAARVVDAATTSACARSSARRSATTRPSRIGHTNGERTVVLRGRTPFAHATLAQLQLDILNNGRITANAGTGMQPRRKGVLTLGRPRVDGTLVASRVPALDGDRRHRARHRLERRASRLRPDARPDRHVPAAAADGRPRAARPRDARTSPQQAGPRGIIPLQVEGEQIAARIVGVVQRFPSIVGDAVVADRMTAATMLDTRSPGLGTTDELWLDVPAGSRPRRPRARTAAVHTADRRSRAPTRSHGCKPTRSREARSSRSRAPRRSRCCSRSSGCCCRSSATCATTAASCSTSRRRARRPRRSARTCDCARCSSPSSGSSAGSCSARSSSALVISLVSVTAGSAKPEPPLRARPRRCRCSLAAAAAYVAARRRCSSARRRRCVAASPARAAEAAA